MSRSATSASSLLTANSAADAPGMSIIMAYAVDKANLPPSTLDNITLYCDADKEAELIVKPLHIGFVPSYARWMGSLRELADEASKQLSGVIHATAAKHVPLTVAIPLLVEKSTVINAHNPVFELPMLFHGTTGTGLTFSFMCFMSGKAYDLHDTLSNVSMPNPTEVSLSVGITGKIVYEPTLKYISAASSDYTSTRTDFMQEYMKMATYLMNFVAHNSSVSAILIQVQMQGAPRLPDTEDIPQSVTYPFLFPVFRSNDAFWAETLCTDFPATDLQKASDRFDFRNLSTLDKLALACYVNYGRLFFSSDSAPASLPTCAYQQYALWKLADIPVLDGNGNPEYLSASQLRSARSRAAAGSTNIKKMVEYGPSLTKHDKIDKDFILTSFSLQDYITTKTVSALAKVLHEYLFLRTARVVTCLALPSEFLFTKASAVAAFSFVAGLQRGNCISRPDMLTTSAELAHRIRYVLNELHSLESIAKSSAAVRTADSSFEESPDRALMYENIPNPEVRKLLEQKDRFIDKLEACIKTLEDDNTRLRQEANYVQPSSRDQSLSVFDSLFVEETSLLHDEKNELVNDIDAELRNFTQQQQQSKQQISDLQKMMAGEGSVEMLERLHRDLDNANSKVALLESDLRNANAELNTERDSCNRLKREVDDLMAKLERNNRLAAPASPTRSMRSVSQLPTVLPQIVVPSGSRYTDDDVRQMRQEYEEKIYVLKEQHLNDITSHKAEIEAMKQAHANQLESFKEAVKNRYIKERDREYAKMKKLLEADYLLKLREIKVKVKEAMFGQLNA